MFLKPSVFDANLFKLKLNSNAMRLYTADLDFQPIEQPKFFEYEQRWMGDEARNNETNPNIYSMKPYSFSSWGGLRDVIIHVGGRRFLHPFGVRNLPDTNRIFREADEDGVLVDVVEEAIKHLQNGAIGMFEWGPNSSNRYYRDSILIKNDGGIPVGFKLSVKKGTIRKHSSTRTLRRNDAKKGVIAIAIK